MQPVKIFFYQSLLLFSSVMLFSCQKIDTSQEESTELISDGKVQVTFAIADIEHIPFESTSSKAVALSSLCSRFSVALFQGDTKVKVVNQSTDSNTADFGQLTMSLSTGSYQIVAIAHNGQGNCTISSPDKITFQNNKLTDTFYYYGTINITETTTQQLSLSRPVSMFRLKITDDMPSNVVQMKFYYTGGSSTFNAVSGYGCVNSRQTEIFSIDSSYYGKLSTFEVYSFPHEDNDFLNVTVTALDANGSTVAESELENLFIQPNVITQHTCDFFGSTSPSSDTKDSISIVPSFVIKDDGKWSDVISQ